MGRDPLGIINPLDAATEFADPAVDAAAAAKDATEQAAVEAEAKKALDLEKKVGTLETTLTEKVRELTELRSKTAILDKLQEVLGARPVNKEEEFVTAEIRRRLGGDLDDIQKIKAVLPAVVEMLTAMQESKLAEKVEEAQGILGKEMEKAGLDPEDEEVFAYMEDAISGVIKRDRELSQLWQSGQTKKAVSKAFDKFNAKTFAPLRTKAKKSAVDTILSAPKATPRGSAPAAPAGQGGRSVDLRDTSRDGIKKIHDAAFDRLQELAQS
jgi:hypothetical protein